MQFIKKNLTPIIALLLAVAAFYIYYAYFSGGPSPLLSQGEQSPASQDLLLTLTDLQSIKLDPALFKDPAYQSLTDFGVTIPQETPGRTDPFAPVGSSGTAPASTSTKSH